MYAQICCMVEKNGLVEIEGNLYYSSYHVPFVNTKKFAISFSV